jgi:putative ABC transport system ATP-binding protein
MLDRLNIELGKTIVMVTHDRRAAEKAHAIMYLEKGELSDAEDVHERSLDDRRH